MNYEAIVAKSIVNHSCKIKAGDYVYINVIGYSCKLVEELVLEIYNCQAIPFVHFMPNSLIRMILSAQDTMQIIKALKLWSEIDSYGTRRCDCYIEVMNDDMLSDLKLNNLDLYKKYYYTPTQWIYRHSCKGNDLITRWVTIRNPSNLIFAHSDNTIDKSLMWIWKCYMYDYSSLSKKVSRLVELMKKTSIINVQSANTDLTLSIKGQPVIVSDGQVNIPDGEIYVAPVLDSINGKITFNVPIWYMGERFQYISLTVIDGKVVQFDSDNKIGLERILSIDTGARSFGEFAIGINPVINKPIGNILFDEKMFGTIHMALGSSLPLSNNGNTSNIHFDMLLDLRKNGKIMFDDVTIFSDGEFSIKELNYLNEKN